MDKEMERQAKMFKNHVLEVIGAVATAFDMYINGKRRHEVVMLVLEKQLGVACMDFDSVARRAREVVDALYATNDKVQAAAQQKINEAME